MHRTVRRSMLFLSESNVRQCLSMKDCIDVNRQALSSIGRGANVPSRLMLQYKNNAAAADAVEDWTLFKPAAQEIHDATLSMGMKLVSIRSQNPSNGLPLVPATILVVDPPSGIVEAVLSGTYLTGARTACGSALATEIAAPYAKHLVIFGAGLQAVCHIDALSEVLKEPLERITIVNRSRPRAEELVAAQPEGIQTEVVLLEDKEGIRRVLGEADVVVTCTNTTTPLFDGAWLKPGCHVNGIGSYTPAMQEVDVNTVQRSTVWIDTPEAATVGDLKESTKSHLLLADVMESKSLQGIQEGTDCTFYKGVGTAIQDVMTGAMVVKRARELGIGQEVDMS